MEKGNLEQYSEKAFLTSEFLSKEIPGLVEFCKDREEAERKSNKNHTARETEVYCPLLGDHCDTWCVSFKPCVVVKVNDEQRPYRVVGGFCVNPILVPPQELDFRESLVEIMNKYGEEMSSDKNQGE